MIRGNGGIMLKQLAAIALSAGLSTTHTASAADLTIDFGNIASNNGTIQIALFDGADGFPFRRIPLAVQEVGSVSGTVNATFSNLEPGTYAVSLFHDENGNQKLDKNLLGIPSEGYGFSNNARRTLGPPNFSAAAFQFGAIGGRIYIALSY